MKNNTIEAYALGESLTIFASDNLEAYDTIKENLDVMGVVYIEKGNVYHKITARIHIESEFVLDALLALSDEFNIVVK